ncbi:MAG: helix-turn-helix domain-containing protein [Ignavibacteriaceae bacterium]
MWKSITAEQDLQNNEVLKKLQRIESLLDENKSNLLNFNQAAQYLSISHSHLYKLTSQRKIPFHKPTGKYLYFFKSELDKWIQGTWCMEDGIWSMENGKKLKGK